MIPTMITMSSLKERLNAYEDLMHLRDPMGFLLLFWPTLSSLWVASNGMPPFSLILVVFMGCLLFRSAGCVLTRWHDRTGPVAQGIVSSWEVAVLVAVLYFFVFCFIWLTTKMAIILFFVALAFVAACVLLRRATIMPQVLIGIVFSLSVPFGFAFVLDETPWQAWAMMGVNFFWVVACEIESSIIGHGDKFFSESQAPSFERNDVAIIAFCYIFFFSGIAFFGVYWRWGWPFWLCFAVAILIALLCLFCIKGYGKRYRIDAFRKTQWIGMALFIGIAADFILLHQALPLWKM